MLRLCVVFGEEFYIVSAKAKGIKQELKIQLIISWTSNACGIVEIREDFMSLHPWEKIFPRFLLKSTCENIFGMFSLKLPLREKKSANAFTTNDAGW